MNVPYNRAHFDKAAAGTDDVDMSRHVRASQQQQQFSPERLAIMRLQQRQQQEQQPQL